MDCLNTHQSETLLRLVAEKEGLDIDWVYPTFYLLIRK